MRKYNIFPTLLSTLGLSLGLLAGGCNFEDDETACIAACEPPLTITVRGTATIGTPDVSTSGLRGNCTTSEEPNTTMCAVGEEAGTYDFVVEAPGYAPQRIQVEVGRSSAPCACGYDAEKREITLVEAAP